MGEEVSNDAPLHLNDSTDFDYWIALTPVTVAQFGQFLVSRAPEDGSTHSGLRQPENRPVTSVSWHEAIAFCEWLTERWHACLPAGWRVMLPSEAEWEKAARGGVQIPVEAHLDCAAQGFSRAAGRSCDNPAPQRRYPWGDDFIGENANAEMNVAATSTPDCFGGGRSPYGCEDMTGDVWEWTRSLWGTDWRKSDHAYPYDASDARREQVDADSKVLRVMRGGSWSTRRDVARCAVRGRNHPDVHRGSVGFRVVLRSPPAF